MIKRDLKYLQISDHLKKDAMKKKFKHSEIEEMNYSVEIDDITGIQKKIVSVSADGPKMLSQLLRIGS
jgi:hypothetical protein